jgi:hypothetical protein
MPALWDVSFTIPSGSFFETPLKKVNSKSGELIMAAEAQIFANRRLGRRIVLNLGHLDFDIVSDFDIRISDFNHSGCFMQNKPNLLDAQMNVRSLITVDYENIANWKLGENKANTKPIKPNTNPKQTQFTGYSNERKLSFS